MTKFNKILADHDDVLTHGIILYTDGSDVVYADKACTIPVEGDELKDIYLKGCVVATVSDGVETGSYSKPTSLEVVDDGVYQLGFASAGGGASRSVVFQYDADDNSYSVNVTYDELRELVKSESFSCVLKSATNEPYSWNNMHHMFEISVHDYDSTIYLGFVSLDGYGEKIRLIVDSNNEVSEYAMPS